MYRAERAAERLRPREGGEPAVDEHVVPARAVLVEQQHGLSGRPDARAEAGRLDLHQGDQAMDLGLLGDQLGEDAPQAQRLLAERRAHPVVPGRGRVALVEDQVDHLEHGVEALGEVVPRRQLERHPRLGKRPLRAHDALGHSGLRHEEGARYLERRQAAQQAQRESHPRLGRQHRVAADEHESEQVVLDPRFE